jgi:hypothetical protein
MDGTDQKYIRSYGGKIEETDLLGYRAVDVTITSKLVCNKQNGGRVYEAD